ncbi:hypothetical protein Gasu2_43590 [Galdieria sulphuraria]|uniref:Uncharacterized protein n=1 Tax=Galdieria sulphuraria TaxID=130081 RepID=M2XWC8_GALSU|nr:uncharacterized protein Gasu_47260 [Galdieria sulphuraria]EME27739.1 hypothetical protein Gasu_47260 [Galdieria sulphuraria]GJD10149.1 hypothetical protein Gasu2_43590 [Galdieria sulphuraria]|eukprot:XP_005704259.1 hypothetical protein Gasu_47260 [Galdieria sulphuraria]
MAGGKRPSNYARNSTRNHSSNSQSNFFSLWSAPFVNFVPQQSSQPPHSGSSRYSTEDLFSQESTRSSSLGQGNSTSYSSAEDNESNESLGKTLEQFVEQVAERSCQQAASNFELQLQRLQEKMRYLENTVRTEEEYRNKFWETLQVIDARLDRLEQEVRAVVSSEQNICQDDVNSEQVEQGQQGRRRSEVDGLCDMERSNSKLLVERIENLEAQLGIRLCFNTDRAKPTHSNEVLEQRKDGKQDFQSSVSKMDKTVKRIDSRVEEAMKKMEEASLMQSSAHERLAQRIKQIDELQTSVNAVKKLLEHNLRVQNEAESIVKEQANIIIKHVCAAMQQYTMKRINEYNAFLDSVLRKYLPNYQCIESESPVSNEKTSFDA